MADFSSIILSLNSGTLGTPVWTTVPAAGTGTGKELRWSDGAGNGAVASASWPLTLRPASTQNVAYCYVFTADTTALGYLGTTSTTPVAYANSNYTAFRWQWDNVGTFGSAPIITAYNTTAHDSPVRGDNTILGGNATDTGATARSYLKANAFGRVGGGTGTTPANAPAAAPTNAPVVTDGATGALTPSAGANWLTNYQGLMGDNDWIAFPSTPAAVTADTWYAEYALFMGPNLATGVSVPILSLKYTFA